MLSEDARRLTLAARDGDVKAMKKLLKSGVDVNSRHPLGWCALHTAVMNQNWPAIEFLVQSGAEVNVKDDFSSAPRVAMQERVNTHRGTLYYTCTYTVVATVGNRVHENYSACNLTLLAYPESWESDKIKVKKKNYRIAPN